MKFLLSILLIFNCISMVNADWPPLTTDWPPVVHNKSLPPLQKKIVRYEKTCGPNGCVETPIYEMVEPISFKKAAALLAQGGWSEKDSKRLEEIINSKYRNDVVNHRWEAGTCGMLGCTIHGAQYLDIHKDGSETVAEEQPEGLYSEGFFNSYPIRRWKR